MRSVRLSAAASAALFLLSACGQQASKTGATPPPPPTVAVYTVTSASLTLSAELPGRVESSRVAQVRARTPGIVLQRMYREGSDVKAGDLLFRIDPAQFQASYDSAQAAVAKAEANLAQAELKVNRYTPLVAAQAVSKQEYDDAVTAQKQAAADLATARATRQTAGLTLGYASVTAPIAGRVGRALVTEGALVGQGEATPMATVQTLDPIYVTITQSSAEVLRLRRALADGKLHKAGNGDGKAAAKVTLVTEDGLPYPHAGKLMFAELTVDESTGAIAMRAEIPNPDRALLPGMYVRARLEQAINDTAIAVPQQAVVRGPEGATVLVVGKDNKVTSQAVKADAAQDGRWIISSGLKGGERIIMEGFQKTKPGGTVTPVPWQGPPGAPGAPAASGIAPPAAVAAAEPPAGLPPPTAPASAPTRSATSAPAPATGK